MDSFKCKYSKKCGGCSYIGGDYKEYLKKKEDKINSFLMPFLKEEYVDTFSHGEKKIHMRGMDVPYHYRHKVNAAFGRTAKGEIVSGVYREGTHSIVNIDECLIEHETADSIIRDIRGMLKSFKIKIYDEDLGTGLLRHVMVRVSRSTGEIMVILVSASPIFPSKNNFVRALREKHPEISTVVLNINDKHTSMVLGKRDIVLYGKGRIKDNLCGVDFMLSPQSFFQVNPEMTEKIYRTAIDFAKLKKDTLVIDAYSGIGTISLLAAQKAENVIGVELNPEAVRDARKNAEMNKIKNVSFVENDAGYFMATEAEEYFEELLSSKGNEGAGGSGKKHSPESAKIDKVVFMDPPRSGSSQEFMESLVKFSPDRVVYISCNPETQARDLKYLTENGYYVKRAMAFDQFPWTEAAENVCLLVHE
ncbi:MAG: 23S rRNA (uracil(1939)-C(5))-methyltransferase RlmD [Eubacterium sp.]|nr:23S rRNA (uracil(1939)-C(5))-methyltransferase RlmD [Eubacterium sp.]